MRRRPPRSTLFPYATLFRSTTGSRDVLERGSLRVSHAGILSQKLWVTRRSEVPRIVVLDVDGTLMDTNYLHVEAWARAFEEVGHRVPRVQIHKQVGKGSSLLIQEFVGDEERIEKIEELHTEYYGRLQEHGHPLPGAKELISSLLERGYGVWFVTSAKDEELEHHMSELEIGRASCRERV